jgi:hypothetical protein
MSEPGLNVTLGAARRWLLARVDCGAQCPCCTQFAKVYRRKINSSQGRALVVQYRRYGQEWAHLPDLRMLQGAQHSNEEPKLRYWGLLEEEPDRREDGGRAGWWRVTDLGVQFALGHARVPKYARIYDGRVLGLDRTEMVTIRDALGDRFNYDELMSA